MKNARFIIACLLVLAGLSLSADADEREDVLDQHSELKRLREQVRQSEARLDSLRQQEVKTQQALSGYDEKIAVNRKVIDRLSSQLHGVQDQLAETEAALDTSRQLLERSQRKYLGDLRHFYMQANRTGSLPLWNSHDRALQRNRQMTYLAALAAFETNNISEAEQYLSRTMNRLDELSGEKAKVASLKQKKEVATALEQSKKQKSEKALEKLRRNKLAEGDRMLTLKQAAEEMERVIARLEEERRQQMRDRGAPPGPSLFATLKGQLGPPVKGKITIPFGPAIDPITRLRSFSPGITIRARVGAPVSAVGAGTIAYVGNLRGYGNFVIINHDDEYYSTYAGLADPEVTEGQFVTSSTAIGRLGEDGVLKFELRKGREPLDPVEWIRIDSF